jgi:uncharacterized repeat protein (TIGR01451 family)
MAVQKIPACFFVEPKIISSFKKRYQPLLKNVKFGVFGMLSNSLISKLFPSLFSLKALFPAPLGFSFNSVRWFHRAKVLALSLLMGMAFVGTGTAQTPWPNGSFNNGLTGWTITDANPGLAAGCKNPSATVVNSTTTNAIPANVGDAPNSDGQLPDHPACSPDALQLWPSHGEANHGDWIRAEETSTVPTNGDTCFSFWFAGVFEDYHYLQGQTANNSDAYLLINMLVGGAAVATLDYSWETTLSQITQLTNGQVPALGDGTVCDINGTPNNWGYVPWTEYEINLCKYAGQQVTFQATFYDCDMGGHYGFGYISCLNWNACPPPDMVLTKSNSPSGLVNPGQTITYTITYTNKGAGPADGVIVTDTIPTGTTYVPGSMSSNPIVFFTNQVGNDLIWDVGAVAAGASGTLSFQVTAPHAGCVTFTNIAAETDLDVACGSTQPLSNPVTNWIAGCPPTPIPTHTAVNTHTPVPTSTPYIPTSTSTAMPPPTNTPTPTQPIPTSTSIAIPPPTDTPTPTRAIPTYVSTAGAASATPTPTFGRRFGPGFWATARAASATPTPTFGRRFGPGFWATARARFTMTPTDTFTPSTPIVATAVPPATNTPTNTFTPSTPIVATAVPPLTNTPTNTFTPSTPIVATAVPPLTNTPTNTFTPSTPIVGTIVALPTNTPTNITTPPTSIAATAVAAVARPGDGNTSTPTKIPILAAGAGRVTAWPNILKAGSMVATFHTDSTSSPTLKVSIYTLAGELVQVINGSQGSNQAAWNASGVASGLYLAVVEEMDADGGLLSRQIVKIAAFR